MDPEKLEFLFGGVPEDIDVDDQYQRELLLAPADEEDPNRRLEGILRAIISNQVADDEPPETWSTARRLLALGRSREAVMNEIAMVLSTQVAAAGPEEGPFDPEEYRRGLAELPLPEAEEMREAFVALAREHHPVDADELDRRVAESLGRQPDDPIMRRLLDVVSDRLVEDQVLEYLADDRMVHLADLTAGITLTHRLTGYEIENQVIVGTVDLAPIGHHQELRLKSGESVEIFGDRWLTPEGFLDKLGEGRVLAVTVAEDGLADIFPLADPPPEDPVLVARFRRAYDRVVAEPDVPALVKEIVYELLADDRQLLGAPRMPLEDLCREAGLEVREDMAAHDERLWENQRQIRLWSRAWNAFGGVKESYDAALRVLELAGQAHPSPADLKQAVSDLADERVAEFVAGELIDPDETPEDEVASAQEFASTLIRAAGEGMPKVVAHWFAALLAERAREPVVAEAHLQVALSAGRDWDPVLERAAWYASDRGDGAAALSLLRRMAEPHRQALELLSEFERSPQPFLGRNQPCWCGSGRKFKHCHLKQPEGFPLPERVGWLCFKAVWYLENQAGEALEEVSELARLRAADPEDQESVLESMEDPLIMDLVLTEGGWFEDFLEARGTLLPEDEALLARSWTLVDRTVYEVEEVLPDSGLTVRDLATGERVEVRERTFSRQAQPGWLICARAVPDGESNQFVGGIFSVRPGTEGQLLDLCAEGDQYELAAWEDALHRAPRVTQMEDRWMSEPVRRSPG